MRNPSQACRLTIPNEAKTLACFLLAHLVPLAVRPLRGFVSFPSHHCRRWGSTGARRGLGVIRTTQCSIARQSERRGLCRYTWTELREYGRGGCSIDCQRAEVRHLQDLSRQLWERQPWLQLRRIALSILSVHSDLVLTLDSYDCSATAESRSGDHPRC